MYAVNQVKLLAENLVLRPFTVEDAPTIQELAGDERIADTTASIPYPYPDGEAERWLDRLHHETESGETLAYAITEIEGGEVLGCVSLMHMANGEGELGYWVGVPYWGRGMATRAARSLVAHGFEVLGLRRIQARVLSRNPASGKVLLRLGFIHTGNEPTICGYRQEEQPCDYYELLAPQN